MLRIAHLTDDTRLGGVGVHIETFLSGRLSDCTQSELVVVTPKGSAPKLDADVAIVHFTVNWAKLPFLMSLRLQNPKVRLILEEHSYTKGFEDHCVSSSWRFRTMLRTNYRVFDDIVVVSHAQERWLTAAKIAPGKVIAIPMSRSTEDFSAVPGVQPGGPIRLGAIGRFAFQKGFEDLIEAAKRLDPKRFSLVIGGYGEDEQKLRTLGMNAPHITFLGQVDEPEAFMEAIDVLVMPSRYEAFGLTGLEARAAGRPLIGYTIDGLEDQLSQGGIRVVPGSVEGLAKAMASLTPEKIRTLGAEARSSAQGDYDRHIEAWKRFLGL